MDGAETGRADSLREEHHTSLPSVSHMSGAWRTSRCMGMRTGLGQGGVLAMENVVNKRCDS